jgi:hypothetical protein
VSNSGLIIGMKFPGIPRGFDNREGRYRLLVRKSFGKVRIYPRRGADWTKRLDWMTIIGLIPGVSSGRDATTNLRLRSLL